MPGGSIIYNPNQRYVLRLLGEDFRMHVSHGFFWPVTTGTDLGSTFLWEGYARQLSSPTNYLISDGYGGAHALLLSLSGGINGNVYNGTSGTTFGGGYAPNVGEWVHWCLLWDGNAAVPTIWAYINGVATGRTTFAGPRVTVNVSAGGGVLYVGGSDHSNGHYDVAAIRCWDRGQALPIADGRAFKPRRFFSSSGGQNSLIHPDFFCDYTRPGRLEDLSPRGSSASASGGVEDTTLRFRHNGNLLTHLGGAFDAPTFESNLTPRLPTARWIPDPSCPYGCAIDEHALPAENIPAPAAAPVGARVWDSVGRRNQTVLFQRIPTPGSTEAGSLGPLPWTQGRVAAGAEPPATTPSSFGILGGAFVFLENLPAIMWVSHPSLTSGDVRSERAMGTYDNRETGVVGRVVDRNNFFYANYHQSINTIRIGHVVNGVVQGGEQAAFPGTTTWTHLRMVVDDVANTIKVYYGDQTADTWTQAGSTINSSTFQNATGYGVTPPRAPGPWNSLWRCRSFAVL